MLPAKPREREGVRNNIRRDENGETARVILGYKRAVQISGGGQLDEPFGMTQNLVGEKVAIGKNGDEITERRGRVADAAEPGKIFRAQPIQVMHGLVGIGDGCHEHLHAMGDGLGKTSHQIRHQGAGTAGIAKLNLFEEARHAATKPDRTGRGPGRGKGYSSR